MSHSSLQWRGWVPPRELAEQRLGVIPRLVMAWLCCVRALNARTHVREQVRSWGSPRARRNPLEGGVSPRARWNPLEGAFDWATSAGRGGHRSVGRALCACLGKRCILLLFFAGFKQDFPGFLGDPQGCPRQVVTHVDKH
jgi:hypothetical protein